MITIISLLLQVQSICADFENFGHEVEWIEIKGISFDPCEIKETDLKLKQLQELIEPNQTYKVKYKTDLTESYFLTTIGGK